MERYIRDWKRIWRKLGPSERFSLVILLFLLFVFPVFMIVAVNPVRLFTRATHPITPPLSPTAIPSPSPECLPVNKVITVVPSDQHGCRNIQEAIDNVVGSGYVIRIRAGDYFIKNPGYSPNLLIEEKDNLRIEGEIIDGRNATNLYLERNNSDILIRHSSGRITQLNLRGYSEYGLIQVESSSNFIFDKNYVYESNSNGLVINSSNNITVADSEIFARRLGIFPGGSREVRIQNNIFRGDGTGVGASGGSGYITFNLFKNNNARAILLSGSYSIVNNTFVNNRSIPPNTPGIIRIASPGSGDVFRIIKNIVAFNDSYGLSVGNPYPYNADYQLEILSNDFYANLGGNYSGINDQTGINGNISRDPLFGNNVDYCLLKGSLAILPGGDYMGHKGSCEGQILTPTPILTPPPCVISGDANGDCRVDGIDYAIWFINFGRRTQGGQRDGDFDRSGSVDGLDYAIWFINYLRY